MIYLASNGNREIKLCFDWFIDIIGNSEWERRKNNAKSFSDKVEGYRDYSALLSNRFIPKYDIAGWYLYQIFCFLDNPLKYDLAQGGRIIPIFKRIGQDINGIKKLKFVEERLKRALSETSQEIDSCLFEILVANAYQKCGWNEVIFLPENTTHKTCYILAKRSKYELYIECKRKSKISDYSARERQKWLKLFKPISDFLKNEEKSIILEITFHEEIHKLPSDYLEKVLLPKIPLSVSGILVDNNICTIKARKPYFDRLKKHLFNYKVRRDSPLLLYLLFGYNQYHKGITYGVYCKLDVQFPNYINYLRWGYAAIWYCDSENALFKKASDIKKQFAEAVNQLPSNLPASVHFGIEVYDGELVELIRFKKIIYTLFNFDTKKRDVQWLYFHMFRFTVPPDKNWEVFEDCIYFSKSTSSNNYLLDEKVLIAEEKVL